MIYHELSKTAQLKFCVAGQMQLVLGPGALLCLEKSMRSLAILLLMLQ